MNSEAFKTVELSISIIEQLPKDSEVLFKVYANILKEVKAYYTTQKDKVTEENFNLFIKMIDAIINKMES